jgi:selenide,water dikinase
VLVLTKPLGTAIVTTAAKRGASHALAAAELSMTRQRRRREALRAFQVHACTDVTGFSLLGHGYEMAHGSDIRLIIDSAALPLLPRARELAASGISTGGCQRNRDWLADKVEAPSTVPPELVELAFDPQTSGGLLVAIPERDAPRVIEALTAANTLASKAIGSVAARSSGPWVQLR